MAAGRQSKAQACWGEVHSGCLEDEISGVSVQRLSRQKVLKAKQSRRGRKCKKSRIVLGKM